MLFSVSMFPIGNGSSLARPVADVIDEFDRAGLRYRVSGMDTVIEGEWDEVMPVVRQAERRLRDTYDRVYTMIVVDDHPGSTNRLDGAVEDVEKELGRSVPR